MMSEEKQTDRDMTDGQILVVIIPDKQYLRKFMQVIRELANANDRICYVSLNLPHTTLIKNFEKENVDSKKFFIVDAITQTAEIPEPIENVEFVSSPGALTELSLSISNLLEQQKFDFLIFDSLSTLLVYESEDIVTKFVHSLMAKIRVVGCRAIFSILKQDIDTVLVKDINMFADKIIDVERLTGFR